MASLFVYMNGKHVGEYIQHASGAQEFHYADSWLQLGSQAIPLSRSLPLTEKSHHGEVVFNYFDNLLPENLDIRNRIQMRFGARTNQAFDLLTHIGRDCVGAIQLLPEDIRLDVKHINGTELNKAQIAGELRNYRATSPGLQQTDDFRISIAGAQEKTAFLRHQGKWYKPHGTTPTTHIFKLPIGMIEYSGIDLSRSVENEWLCLEILRAYGLPVVNASIEKFGDQKVLVVERFDRQYSPDKTWIIRLPVEDTCQASGTAAALKYEINGGPGIADVMAILGGSINPVEDRRCFMRAVYLFWLLGAVDGHAKNFSIFLKPGGRFNLAPIYDVLSAYPLNKTRQIEAKKMKMAMSVYGKNKHYQHAEILNRHWLATAKSVDFPVSDMQQIIEQTKSQTSQVIDLVTAKLVKDFPADIAEPILAGLMKMVKKN